MLAVAFASADRNCSTEMSSLRRDPQSRCLSRLVEARSAERQILREGQVVYVGKDSDPQSVRRHHSAAVRTVIDGGSQARALCGADPRYLPGGRESRWAIGGQPASSAGGQPHLVEVILSKQRSADDGWLANLSKRNADEISTAPRASVVESLTLDTG
jgi:hypothetical protein